MRRTANETLLGEKISIPNFYDPTILTPLPREVHRRSLNIEKPLLGFDVWHGYECSFMTNKGIPVNRVLKMTYPSTSPMLVESKSMKLYLNSFNMHQEGDTVDESVGLVTQMIKQDLEQVLQTEVCVTLHQKEDESNTLWSTFKLYSPAAGANYKALAETPQLLQVNKQRQASVQRIRTDLLRSNCKVTNQPDWGDLFVYTYTDRPLVVQSLLAYIVSLRHENGFHEEVVETIYKRIWDICTPQALMVGAIYTRRGGLDISPFRASEKQLLNFPYLESTILTKKGLRQ